MKRVLRLGGLVLVASIFLGAIVRAEDPTAVEERGLLTKLNDAGVDIHGFGEYRIGMRMQHDSNEDDVSLNEFRMQLDTIWNHDLMTVELKSDFVYNDLESDTDELDLESGHGFMDLRMANVLFSPLNWMDVKAGRQVLTWGTGDLVFINDLFPKDWQSFFLGRDIEYLKAPSDALMVSMFPSFANIDLVYTPRFDADRHITGDYISYWNGRNIVGQDSVLDTDQPDEWFSDDEFAARVYRNLGTYEVAVYGYHGFWKSPGGMDPMSGKWLFPELSVYGGSVRGPLGSGIANLEVGYYDSLDDRSGTDPFINNSEARVLAGYEKEVVKDFTVGVQYYLEHMMDYDNAVDAMHDMNMSTKTMNDEDRHTVTLRLTYMMLNQNLILSCFTRYSPSDKDVYFKPEAIYKISDYWTASLGGNIFAGEKKHTFLNQFENNNNVYTSLRCSF